MICTKDKALFYDIPPAPTTTSSSSTTKTASYTMVRNKDYHPDDYVYDDLYMYSSDGRSLESGVSTKSCLTNPFLNSNKQRTKVVRSSSRPKYKQKQHQQQQHQSQSASYWSDGTEWSSSSQYSNSQQQTAKLLSKRNLKADKKLWTNSASSKTFPEQQAETSNNNKRPINISGTPSTIQSPTTPDLLSLPTPTDRSHKQRLQFEQESRRKLVYHGELEPEGVRGQEALPSIVDATVNPTSDISMVPIRRSFDHVSTRKPQPTKTETQTRVVTPPHEDDLASSTSSKDIQEMMNDLSMLGDDSSPRRDQEHSILSKTGSFESSVVPSSASSNNGYHHLQQQQQQRWTPSPTPVLTSTHMPSTNSTTTSSHTSDDRQVRRSRVPTRRQQELHRDVHHATATTPSSDDDNGSRSRGIPNVVDPKDVHSVKSDLTRTFDAGMSTRIQQGEHSPPHQSQQQQQRHTIASSEQHEQTKSDQRSIVTATNGNKPNSQQPEPQPVVKRSSAPVDVDDSSFIEPFSNVEGIHAMAMEHVMNGEYDMALQAFGQVLNVYLAKYGPAHPLVASAHHNLGTVHSKRAALLMDHTVHQRHCREQALLSFQAAARSARDSLGRNHPNVAVSLVRIGFLLLAARQFENAIITFDEALRIRVCHFGERHSLVANLYNNLGVCHMHLGKFDVGREQLGKALNIQRQLLDEADNSGSQVANLDEKSNPKPRSPDAIKNSLLELADTLCNIGGLCLERIRQQGPDQRHATDAEAAFLEALEIRTKVLGPTDPLVLQVRSLHDMVRGIPLPKTTSLSPRSRQYGGGTAASTPTSSAGGRRTPSQSPSRKQSPHRSRQQQLDLESSLNSGAMIHRPRPDSQSPTSPSRRNHGNNGGIRSARSPVGLRLPQLMQPASPMGSLSHLAESSIEEWTPKRERGYSSSTPRSVESTPTNLQSSVSPYRGKVYHNGRMLTSGSSPSDEQSSFEDTAVAPRDLTKVFLSPHIVPKRTPLSPDGSDSAFLHDTSLKSQLSTPSSRYTTYTPTRREQLGITTKFSYDAEESCLLSNKVRAKSGPSDAEDDDPFHWSKYDKLLSPTSVSRSDEEYAKPSLNAATNPSRSSTEIMVVFPRGGGGKSGRPRQYPQRREMGDEKKDDSPLRGGDGDGGHSDYTSTIRNGAQSPPSPSTLSPSIRTSQFSSYSLNPRGPVSRPLLDMARSSTDHDRESCMLRAKAILEAHRDVLEGSNSKDDSLDFQLSSSRSVEEKDEGKGIKSANSADRYGEELGQDDGLAPLGGSWPTSSVDEASNDVIVTPDILKKPEQFLPLIHNCAAQYLKQNRFGEALQLFEVVLECQRKRHGPLHEDVGAALHNVGICNLRMEHHTVALQIFEEAVRIRKGSLGNEHPQVAVSLVKVGITLLLLRRFEDSLWVFREALNVRKHALGALHPSTARIFNNIGCVHVEFQELREARRAFEAALDIQRNALCHDAQSGPILFGAATTLCNLGYLYKTRDMHEKAALVLREALNLQEKVLGDRHPTVLSTLDSLAEACATSSHATHALKYYNEILERFHRDDKGGDTAYFGSNTRRKRAEAVLLFKMSRVHRQQNDLQSQLAKLKQALEVVRSVNDALDHDISSVSQADQEQHANLVRRIEKEYRQVQEEMDKLEHELQWI